MINMADYIANPCGTSSIPYWKAKQIMLPPEMRILHQRDFTPALLGEYVDERYFRLLHCLKEVEQPVVPAGYALYEASDAEYAAHINLCYGGNLEITELAGWRARAVYDAALWIALCEEKTRKVVATGIAELDREIGECALEWIQVSPDYRGRGLGAYLVRELLWRVRNKADFVTVSGQRANPTKPEALYRSCGFVGNDVWHILRKR